MATQLKHDAQGFLVGDPIDLKKLLSEWGTIRNDVRAIRQAVRGIESAIHDPRPQAYAPVLVMLGDNAGRGVPGAAATGGEVAQPIARMDGHDAGRDAGIAPLVPDVRDRPGPAMVAAPASRGRDGQHPVLLRVPVAPGTEKAGGNDQRRATQDAETVVRTATKQRATLPVTLPAAPRKTAQPASRDGRGRFVARDDAAGGKPGEKTGRNRRMGTNQDANPALASDARSDREDGALRTLAGRFAGVLSQSIGQSGSGLQEADPAVKALGEVAQPMARGYALLTGGDRQKRQEGWLRRIFQSLTGMRKEEGVFRKTETKLLKDIRDKKPTGKGGLAGMLGSVLVALLRFIPGLGLLLALLRRIPCAGLLARAGRLFSRGGFALGGRLSRGIKSVGRRVGRWLGFTRGADRTGYTGAGRGARGTVAGGRSGRAARAAGAGEAGGFAQVAGEAAGAGSAARTAGVAGVGRAGKVGKAARSLLKLGRGLGGGLLKRVPLLGTLLTLGGAAADVYASEHDDTLSRREKDKRAGKAIGGAGGSLGGMAAGAALGATVGSVVPVVGTAIGGIIGGAAGMFFGEKAGEVLGGKVGEWVNAMRAAKLPGKIMAAWKSTTGALKDAWESVRVVALGTWDWIRAGFGDAIGKARDIFGKIGEKWNAFVEGARTLFQNFSDKFSNFYEGLKQVPLIGPLIKKAGESAKAATEVVTTVTGKVLEGLGEAKDRVGENVKPVVEAAGEYAGQAVDGAKNLAVEAGGAVSAAAGKAWTGAKDLAASGVPRNLKKHIAIRRAMETGANYRQGNIAGLDDAHTRALVASTAETESGGGNLRIRNLNDKGYVGRYQASAGWLADAGLIRGGGEAVKAAMKKDGHTNEWKWAVSGGMDRFLKNDANWVDGMSLAKYMDMASADVQDAAFKKNSDKSYASMLKRGIIAPGMSQDKIAGLLKARHISGENGAAQVAKGGTGPADVNGTSARDYFNNMKAGNIYATFFSSGGRLTSALPATEAGVPDKKPPPSKAPGVTSAQAQPASNAAAQPSRPISSSASAQPGAQDKPQASGNASAPQPVLVTAPGENIATPPAGTVAQAPASAPPVAGFAAPAMPVVAAASVPAVPPAPAVPAIAEAPPVAVPLGAGDARKPVTVVSAPSDVGQDLRERGIAHIVTGGLGASQV